MFASPSASTPSPRLVAQRFADFFAPANEEAPAVLTGLQVESPKTLPFDEFHFLPSAQDPGRKFTVTHKPRDIQPSAGAGRLPVFAWRETPVAAARAPRRTPSFGHVWI